MEPCQTAATHSLDLDIFSNIGSPPVFPLFQCCLWKNEANNEIEVKRCSSHTISVGAGLKINKRCVFTFLFRLKLPNILNTTSRFLGQGTSSSLVYIIWAVFGGFLMHIILSNYLTVLLKPEFETPVDTTKDLVSRNIIPYYIPGGHIWKQFFADSPDPLYQIIAEKLIIPRNWAHYDELCEKVIEQGTHANIATVPDEWERSLGHWYRSADFYESFISIQMHRFVRQNMTIFLRSTESLPGEYVFGVHLANKKWPLLKVLYKEFQHNK